MANVHARRLVVGTISINVLLSFIFGIVFLAVMLGFAAGFPNPTPFQIQVFITTLALSAGGVGAMLPGFLHVESRGVLGTLRAGGAVAFAGVVYFAQPALTQTAVTLKAPAENPEPAAMAVIEAVDRGDYAAAYKLYDVVAKQDISSREAEWLRISENFRKPLGAVVSRKLTGSNTYKLERQEPIGVFHSLVYTTKFQNDTGCRMEQVTLRGTQEEDWRVFSYLISPTYVPC